MILTENDLTILSVFCIFIQSGVYLPVLWESSFCWKNPIALGYTRGHFSALVPMETSSDNNIGASSSVDFNEDAHVTYFPLVDHEGHLLPIHFQTAEEVSVSCSSV